MQLLLVFATALLAAAAQDFSISDRITEEDYDGIINPRFRRDVSLNPKTGDVTWDRKTDNSRVYGTVGATDTGLFGQAGYEKNIFKDNRGQLDGHVYGRRDLSPYGHSSSVGGGLKWQNENAAASFDVNKQIRGSTSWSASGGGRWPVGKNGNFGLDGTYNSRGGKRSYGGRATYNHRW